MYAHGGHLVVVWVGWLAKFIGYSVKTRLSGFNGRNCFPIFARQTHPVGGMARGFSTGQAGQQAFGSYEPRQPIGWASYLGSQFFGKVAIVPNCLCGDNAAPLDTVGCVLARVAIPTHVNAQPAVRSVYYIAVG
jgi:hypothetical protein